MADSKRFNPTHLETIYTGVYSITIKKGGSILIQDPNDAFTKGTISVKANQLVFHFADCLGEQAAPRKNLYRWRISGKLLTITRVSDPRCPDRAGLFHGAWKRK